MSSTKVSVIIPNYNTALYIERTVKSLVNQTHKNVEIIIVDDCSKDNSAEVCSKIAESSPNIKLILKKKNEGQTLARNDGLSVATGDWIVFLDSDDILKEDVLESYLKIALEYNPDIIFAGYETINTNKVNKKYFADIDEGLYSSKEFGTFFFNKIPMNVLTCIGAKMYNASFLKERKTPTSAEIKTNYDMAFVIDALICADNVYYINKVNYTYLLRENSITYSYRTNMFCNICRARSRIKDYLIKCNCYDEKRYNLEMSDFVLLRMSLAQEIKHKKGFSSFKAALLQIVAHNRTKEISSFIYKQNGLLFKKMFMKLIELKMTIILYAVFKLESYIR